MGEKLLKKFSILSLMLGWIGVLLVFIDIFYPLNEKGLNKDFYIIIGILLSLWFFGIEIIIFLKNKIENYLNDLNISDMVKNHIHKGLEKNIGTLLENENIIKEIARNEMFIERISGAIALADSSENWNSLENNLENRNSLIEQAIWKLNTNNKSFSLDDLYNEIKDTIQTKYPNNINPKATLRGIFYRDFLDTKKVIRKERWKYILSEQNNYL